MATRHSVSRWIASPPERVWALLTDHRTYPDWNPAVVSIAGEIRAGGRISVVSIADPTRTFRLKVARLAPPSTMVWSSGMPLGLFRGERTFTLEPHDGGTRFSMTEVFSGPMAGLVAKSMPDLTDSFERFADGLLAAAEAQPPGGEA